MSQSEDLAAINDYMKRTAAVTPEATKLRQSWLTWYPSLSWYQLNFSTDIRDEASTRRNKFNLANATSPAAKANVERVIMTGMDTNQMQGGQRKETLPTGEVGTQIKKPSVVDGSHPTIKQGSSGPAVKEWQTILGTTADGKFGPNTHTLTVAWQKKKGLTADGVVGAKTWTAALGAPPPEAVKKEEPGLLASLLGTSAPAAPAPTPAKPTTSKPVTTTVASSKPPTASGTKTSTAQVPPKTSTPIAVASSGGSKTSTSTPVVAQAGMLSSLTNLPLWAKVGAGVAGVLALFFAKPVSFQYDTSLAPKSYWKQKEKDYKQELKSRKKRR